MPTEKRPTSVTVIGWIWSIIGGLNILSGLIGVYNLLASPDAHPQDMPDDGIPIGWLVPSFLAQIVVGGLCLISAIKFLQLKSWARTVLEGLTWLLLLGIVVQAYVQFKMMLPDGIEGASVTLWVVVVSFTGMIVLFWFSVGMIILKHLRGPTIKNAVAGMSGTAESPPEETPQEDEADSA